MKKLVERLLSTEKLLQSLADHGNSVREWGKSVDGKPLLSVRVGGDRKPAVFITAGSHATESAGVLAALNLIDELETEHEVHILPLRDPFGFAGLEHCLSFAAGQKLEIEDHEWVLDFLQAQAEELFQEQGRYLFKLGEIGFAWLDRGPELECFWEIYNWLGGLSRENPEVFEPLKNKSVMLINPAAEVEGAGELQRCWHGWVNAEGKFLHLNRMFGEESSPPEVKAVDALLGEIKPGLICDLHEGNGDGFWLPLVKPETNPERLFEMAQAFFKYVQQQGYPITDYENWMATDHTPHTKTNPEWMCPEERLPGLFWMDTLVRGEGHNLSTYASLQGIAFGTESPMGKSLSMRVDALTQGTLAAIKAWEKSEKN
jgi:hypothetical protein